MATTIDKLLRSIGIAVMLVMFWTSVARDLGLSDVTAAGLSVLTVLCLPFSLRSADDG